MINVWPLLYITNSLRTGMMCVDADDVPLGSIFPRFSCKFNLSWKFAFNFLFALSPFGAVEPFGMFPSRDMLSCSCHHFQSHCHPHFHLRRSSRVLAFCTFDDLKVESWECVELAMSFDVFCSFYWQPARRVSFEGVEARRVMAVEMLKDLSLRLMPFSRRRDLSNDL